MTAIDHRWDILPSEGIALQKELRTLVSRKWDGRKVGKVGGLDVHFPSKNIARAVAVIMSFPRLETIETSVVETECTFPYVPGLLSFREIPPLLKAIGKLKTRADIFLCDGQGIAHPRGLGLASHLGLILDSSTIGCAKSPLFGRFTEPGPEKGMRSPIKDRRGNTIGYVLRTRAHTSPIYVSIGHKISLRKAVSFVLQCTPRFRIPEPLRLAHHLAGRRD